ncbi:hypothetical protein PG985_010768 [Apiospora marii]|uniref:C3H1-type domain-containing protein n=1 Tax=Apiospora marii TaxID=335849 RepID=A0ABR1T1W0_9PEZI
MSSSNGRRLPNSSPPPVTMPWTPSRHPSGPPSESDTPDTGGGSRRSSNATTILFTGRRGTARQGTARQSSSGGDYSSNVESRATSPRSSAPDWRSTASPANATVFSPTGTPPVPTGAYVPPPRPLSAAASDFNNNSYGNNAATTATTPTAARPFSSLQSYPGGLPQHYHGPSSAASLNAIAAAPVAPPHGPQVPLTAKQASYLVCPWWWTYSRCGQRGCNFSHALGTGLKQQPLICPYWLRSPGTTGAGCNKAEGACQFAHYHCEHGQKAPVPKPK